MRRREDQFELSGFVGREIEGAVAVDIRLDAADQTESFAPRGVEPVDRAPLLGCGGHRHPSSDLQTVGVIGHRREAVAARKARIDDLVERG